MIVRTVVVVIVVIVLLVLMLVNVVVAHRRMVGQVLPARVLKNII